MGVDIYTKSGILASIEDMCGFLDEKNPQQIIQVCQTFYNDMAKECEENPDCSWRKKRLEFFGSLNNIQAETIEEIQSILTDVVQVEGEPAKYDLDTHVQYSEELLQLWNSLLEIHKEKLPALVSVSAWGSSRYNGYDVPLGVACFVFESEDCYTRRLTKKGKNLEKIIGHCQITDWTVYSC